MTYSLLVFRSSSMFLRKFGNLYRALNRLAGYKFMNSSQLSQPATAVQRLVLDRICSAFHRAGVCPEELTAEKALGSMLRSKNLYAEEPSNLVPYDPDKLKILQSKVIPKRLESVLPPHVLSLVKRRFSVIERSGQEVQEELKADPFAMSQATLLGPRVEV